MIDKLKSKNLYVGIIVFVAIILLLLLIFLLRGLNKSLTYDLNSLNRILTNEYVDLHFFEMDRMDVLELFGYEKEEAGEDALYLKSLEMDIDGNDITESINQVVIINTENYQYYYDIFDSYLESYRMNAENKEAYDLYNNAILKCDKNYVYLIVGEKASEIEKDINLKRN